MITFFSVLLALITMSASDHEEKTALFRAMKDLAVIKESPNVLKSIKELQNEFGDKITCEVCWDSFGVEKLEKFNSLECGHFFCRDCLKTWNQPKQKCPKCRKDIKYLHDCNRDKLSIGGKIRQLSKVIESLQSIRQTENRENAVKFLQKQLIEFLESAKQKKETKRKIKELQEQIYPDSQKKMTDIEIILKDITYISIKISSAQKEIKERLNSEIQTLSEPRKQSKFLVYAYASIEFFLLWNFLYVSFGAKFFALFWGDPMSFSPSIQACFNSTCLFSVIFNYFNAVQVSRQHLFILILILVLCVQIYSDQNFW